MKVLFRFGLLYRSSINLYIEGDDLATAETIAHEIGHNLNMQHDFTDPFSDPKTPRSCPTDGSTCTGISGIMDYFEPRPLSWTCCSRHDYTSLFNEYNDLQNWCLEKYVAPSPPPPPPPPPATELSNCWNTCIEVSTLHSVEIS